MLPAAKIGGTWFMTVVHPQKGTRARFLCDDTFSQDAFDVRLAHAIMRCQGE
jgi:hypothetical protein